MTNTTDKTENDVFCKLDFDLKKTEIYVNGVSAFDTG